MFRENRNKLHRPYVRLTLLATAVFAIVLGGGLLVSADRATQPAAKPYYAVLEPMNGSNVRGTVRLSSGQTGNMPSLQVNMQTTGWKPGAQAAAGVFGKTNGGASACPTLANDYNRTKYLNLGETITATGSMKYAFMANPADVRYAQNQATKVCKENLYAPTVGVPANKTGWPKASPNGTATLAATYKFNPTAKLAPQLYASMQPLEGQSIVVIANHANDVATPTPNRAQQGDSSVPVACARIVAGTPPANTGTAPAATAPTPTSPAGQQPAGVDAYASAYQAAEAGLTQKAAQALGAAYTAAAGDANANRQLHDVGYAWEAATSTFRTEAAQAVNRYRTAVATDPDQAVNASRTLQDSMLAARQKYLDAADRAALGLDNTAAGKAVYSQYNTLRAAFVAQSDQARAAFAN